MNSLLNLSVADLRKAAQLKEQIDGLNNELAAILTEAEFATPVRNSPGRGRGMSAAGRARIAAAARARWAKIRAARGISGSATPSGPKKRRSMSPEARAKIAAAQRARWAKAKKLGK